MNFISELEEALRTNGSVGNAAAMEKYMKFKFPFLGIKTPERRKILNSLWRKHQSEISENAREIGPELFNMAEREFHHCGIEILIKELKGRYLIQDEKLIQKLITTHSWWDSVDFIAKYLLGNFLLQFPDHTERIIGQFSDSHNMWLNRTAIIFQLGYREKTRLDILFSECEKHSQSKEFFIQKAIGWALREYAKVDPISVKMFVKNSDLRPLSRREALKHFS